jgi:hypothetical protein
MQLAPSESWDGWKQEAKEHLHLELNVCHFASKVPKYGQRWVSSLIQLRFEIAWDLPIKGISQEEQLQSQNY